MISKKLFWTITTLLIVLNITLPTGVWYYQTSKRNQALDAKDKRIAEIKKQASELEDEISKLESELGSSATASDYKTYTNNNLGFSFQYPKQFLIERDELPTTKTGMGTGGNSLLLTNSQYSFTLWVNPDGFDLNYAEYSYNIVASGTDKLVLSNKQNNPEPETNAILGYDPDYINIDASTPSAISDMQFIVQFRYPVALGDKTTEFEKFFTDFKLI